MAIYRYSPDELYHFGVKGQKWGRRRYQNEDGSYKSGAEGRYNPEGPSSKRKQYSVSGAKKAALYGGVIGYGAYRATHKGRKEAIANYKAEKKAAKDAKYEAKKARKGYDPKEARRAALEGGLIGYGMYRRKAAKNQLESHGNHDLNPKVTENKKQKQADYDKKAARRAALEGGLIGYGMYRHAHKEGRKEAVAQEKAAKQQAKADKTAKKAQQKEQWNKEKAQWKANKELGRKQEAGMSVPRKIARRVKNYAKLTYVDMPKTIARTITRRRKRKK